MQLAVIVEKEGRYSNEELDIILPFSFLNFIKNLWRVRRVARDFDIVHALDGWPYAVYGYVAVLRTEKKLFVTAIGIYTVVPLENFFKNILLRLAYKKAR